MANWLERAQREIQQTPSRPAANTDERPLTSVTAVPRREETGISRGSNVSNGSPPAAGSREIEGCILAHPNPLPPLPPAAEARRSIPLWWRVAIQEPGGRTVEVDTPSGWTLTEWEAYAERYHGPGCSVTPIAGLPKPRAIAAVVFRALMSPEDLADT